MTIFWFFFPNRPQKPVLDASLSSTAGQRICFDLFEIAWLVKTKHKKTLECCGLRMLWATCLCSSFAKIWQQASIISLHKEGNFGIPLPSFQNKQVANCKRGREAVIHPCILLREEGEATWFFVEKMEMVAGSKASTSCSMRLISVVHSSSLAKSGTIR